jgi:hypothetical protein
MVVVQANAITINPSARKIDLFTQKEPYSGRGINNSSDTFSPRLDSEVIFYALVTYNEEPLESFQVGFQVNSPNSLPGFPLLASAITNASGIAMISFRLRQFGYQEQNLFGTWHGVATVEIAGAVVSDTLTFRVGYIVEITSIDTIDENFNPRTRFARGTCISAGLHIRNIAMLPKTATIVVTAYDALKDPFDSITLNDFILEPGDTYIFDLCFLNISEQAEIGVATINATAFTTPPRMGGIPYSPGVSAQFLITSRDIAVISVTASPIDIVAGQIVNVTIVVSNKGNDTETFLVSAYYGEIKEEFLIQRVSVASLSPNQNRTITLHWSTTHVPPGSYDIFAVAEPLRGERERGDNTKKDDTVIVRVPIFMFPRELSVVALIVAGALALFAIILLLTRKKNNPQPTMLNVDVLPTEK